MYDLEQLLTEHPTHPRQQGIRYLHELKARRYWAKRNRETMNKPGLPTRDMVTIVQASQRFGVSNQTILRWIDRGKVHTEKVRGRRLLDIDEMQAFYETQIAYTVWKRKVV